MKGNGKERPMKGTKSKGKVKTEKGKVKTGNGKEVNVRERKTLESRGRIEREGTRVKDEERGYRQDTKRKGTAWRGEEEKAN